MLQPGTYTEHELVALLKSKDEQAFSYLYDHYAGALNNIIFRMVGEDVLAEDILQEAFLKIWNNIHNYDETKGRLFTWMLNLTRNLAIDTLRSKGYKNAQKTTGHENFVSNIADDKSVAERFDSLGVQKLVKQLKPEQQLIIDLGYFQGYTQDEISKAMNIPLGTVKTRMRAGILELRKLILDKSF